MKKLKALLAIAAAGAIAASSVSFSAFAESDETTVPETSIEVAAAMGNGINLGNTLESCDQSCIGKTQYASTVNGYETLWGAPTTTKEMIQGMKAAGYNTVRIPIAWSNLMSDNGVVEEGNTYTINEELMSRVEEIVNWVLDEDMYCIINCHWDGGWWPQLAATNKDRSANEEVRAEAMKKYKAIWTQVGEHFKDYSNKLIFESANEELGDDFTDSDFGYGVKQSDRYEVTNEVNQTFVDLIRSQGGNNSDRFLLIAGYNTDIDKTCSKRFVMPTDTATDKLLVSVHYYAPSDYCLVSDPDNSWGYRDTWGTDDDVTEMKDQLAKMLQFTEQGYGVVIGEYGAFRGENNTIKEGTYLWYQTLIETCEELGYCPVAWETSNSSNNYGDWYNRKECKITDETMAAIYADNSAIKLPELSGGTVIPVVAAGSSKDGTEVTVTIDDSSETINTKDRITYISDGDISMYLPDGSYTMTFSSENCAPRAYDVVIFDGDVSNDVSVELNLLGDVNGDGKTEIKDLSIVYKSINETKPLDPESYEYAVANVDGEGEVDIKDYSKIYKHINETQPLY